jgi:hypothetical protein
MWPALSLSVSVSNIALREAAAASIAVVFVKMPHLLNLGNNLAIEHGHGLTVICGLLEQHTLFIRQIAFCFEKVPLE